MGDLISCKCKECGNDWIRSQGPGMMCTFYHCDKCGKEISVLHDMEEKRILECECGGLYANLDQPVICPECNGSKIEIDFYGNWD